MKTLSNATIQDMVDAHPSGQIYTKDGKQQAKVGLEIFRKEKENKWVLVSDNGIDNGSFNSIRLGKGGRIL